MEFKVLGGLDIRKDGRPLALGAPKQRTLTALLLVRTNAVVPMDEIIEELWGDDPPRSATANLRTYAARLRAALPRTDRDRLTPCSSGYRLAVEAGELDLNRFDDEVTRGRAALEAGDAAEALRRLDRGLGLWRGRLTEDVRPGPVIAAREVTVDARRRGAEEDRCEALLLLGRAPLAVEPLRSLVAEQPLRERAWVLLMRALYAVGDMGGAVDAFARARTALIDALGVEPGEELQRVHRAVLRRDLGPIHVAAATTATPVAPRQLPSAPVVVGRTRELRDMARLAAGGTVVVVHGPAGSGTSAVALRAAHEIAGRYPDGLLYLDLRPRPDGAAALRRLLTGLGAPDPIRDADVAAARYRSLLADRRALVVLDNAVDAAQIRALLPAAPGCTVLVASCQMLTTVDGARHISLGDLDTGTATALLARHVDPDRLHADPGATRDLVRLCGHQPLALRIAAARLAAHPDRPVRALVDRLAADDRRLDELEAGDLSVRASLRVPYDALAGGACHTDRLAAAAFRLLGSAPDRTARAADLAVTLQASLADVGRALDRLVEMGLLGGDQRPTALYRLLAREMAPVGARRLRLSPCGPS